jgi:predicted methyltransferase
MRRKSMLAALASVVIAWGTPALADPASDAVADQSRSEADWALDEGRNPVEVLRFSGPSGGGVTADFMAGDGYYSALLAQGKGRCLCAQSCCIPQSRNLGSEN